MSKSHAQRKRMLARLFAKNPKCHYCGTTLTKDNRSVDHLVPLSRGGPNKRRNLVASCQACNNKKGSSTPYEFALRCSEFAGGELAAMEHRFNSYRPDVVGGDALIDCHAQGDEDVRDWGKR